MKEVTIFNKGKVVGDYINIEKIEGRGVLNASEPMFTLNGQEKDDKVILDQGVDILLVYSETDKDIYEDLKGKSKKYLINLNIPSKYNEHCFKEYPIFGYSSSHDKISFYLDDESRSKIEVIFTTKESRESVHVALMPVLYE